MDTIMVMIFVAVHSCAVIAAFIAGVKIGAISTKSPKIDKNQEVDSNVSRETENRVVYITPDRDDFIERKADGQQEEREDIW